MRVNVQKLAIGAEMQLLRPFFGGQRAHALAPQRLCACINWHIRRIQGDEIGTD